MADLLREAVCRRKMAWRDTEAPTAAQGSQLSSLSTCLLSSRCVSGTVLNEGHRHD